MFSKSILGTWVVELVAVLAFLALVAGEAYAHPGGYAQDGCHKEKASGERHGLVVMPDGSKVTLPCDLRATYMKAVAVAGNSDALKTELYDQRVEIDRLRARVERHKLNESQWAGRVEESEAAVSLAIRNLKAAKRRAEKAVESADKRARIAHGDMLEAEQRARGTGPAVSSRCKRGLYKALDTGWRFDGDEKDALRRACLE